MSSSESKAGAWYPRKSLRSPLRPPRDRRLSFVMTAWLMLVWVSVFGWLTPLSMLGALILAILVQVVFPLPHRAGNLWFHPVWLVWLMARFVWDMVRAGVHVAGLVLFSRPRTDSILRCSVRSDNPEYLTILAAMTSLIPGTIVIRIDRAHRTIYLHCLDVEGQGGAEAIRRATSQQEERILRAVAPKSVQRQLGLGGIHP